MATDYTKQLDEETKKYQQALGDSANLTAEDIEGMTRMAQSRMQQIYDNQLLKTNESIGRLEGAQKAAEKSGADLILEMDEDRKRREQEGKAQVEADNRAARWTSVAEAAAAVANMIGVGSFNAVSQKYKSYSQDWMNKADRDLKEHRSRMDNINDRLRAQKGKLDALKLGNAQALEAMRQKAAGDEANAAIAINNIGLKGQQAAAEARAKGRDTAAKAGYEGAKDVVNVGLTQDRMKQADNHFWATKKMQETQFNAKMAAQGLNSDGTVNEGLMAQREAIIKKYSGGKGGGKDNTIEYPIIDGDGNVNLARMKPAQMETLMLDARSAIKKDLGEADAYQFEREFRMAADDKARNAVIMEWIGKSPMCETIIRTVDEAYRGKHGTGTTQTIDNTSGYSAPKEQKSEDNNVGIGLDNLMKDLDNFNKGKK